MEWAVTVGNIGQVYVGDNECLARADYREWSLLVDKGYGRCEAPVVLWCDGEPVLEHGETSNE